MTLRFSSPDNFANSRDNLSRTVSQSANSRQIQKNILSADSSSLRWTIVHSLTAFLKTIYNKVARQLLSRFTVAQAQTAEKKIGRQILHSVWLAHLRSYFNEVIFIGRKRAILTPSKTRSKEF